MTDSSRIEDLRRRVLKDSASIAFAQLAEEYRRAGECEEAIRVCVAGLAQHPAFLAARVTLGLALFELGRLEEARAEFLRVLDAAPDNVVAAGKLAEIHQRIEYANQLPGASRPTETGSGVTQQQSRQAAADAQVLAELEAWLQVITRSRR